MAASLGWDVVHKDRCALHSDSLSLHRVHKSPGSDEESQGQIIFAGEQELLVQRWSILWRSICLASMGKTMFPYHSYLRSLDLRDLENMLEDLEAPHFNGKIERKFFEGDMAPFHLQTKIVTRRGTDFTRLNSQPILEGIATMIATKTHMLEQVSGRLPADAFVRWVPNMPRLKRLELYDGSVLSDLDLHKTIYQHCRQFESLSIFMWSDPDADKHLGAFISGLPAQTLKDLITISNCGISAKTCTALDRHSSSLKRLDLSFAIDGVKAMPLLKGCTAIESLRLSIPSQRDLKEVLGDSFQELLTWVGECINLKEVTLDEFGEAGPALLTPVLLHAAIQLEEISLDNKSTSYAAKDNREFHQALSHQKSLHTLCLRGDGDDAMRDDLDAMVDSMNQLTNLRKLDLRGVADFFGDAEIIRLLSPLTKLEEVCVGGWSITDAVLPTVAALPKLRAMNFVAITEFTRDGLLSFVSSLGAGNDGMHLAIDNADFEHSIEEEELGLVREALAKTRGGRLDYIPLR
jgi:hypothetical protein